MPRLILFVLLIIASTATSHAQLDRKALARVDSLVRTGHASEALAIVDAQVAKNRSNALLLRMRGMIHMSMGTYDRAKADFQSSLAIDPEGIDNYLALASIDLIEQNPRLAISRLNSAIDLDKSNGRAWFLRAEARRALGEYTAAVGDYANAVRIEPKNSEYHAARGLNDIMRGNNEEALASLNRAIELTPTVGVLYGMRARAYATSGRMAEALPDMTRSIELGATGADVYITRGAIYGQLGRHLEAIADYDRALAIDSNSIDALYNRSLSRYESEDMEGSCADTRRLIELATRTKADPKLIEGLRSSLVDHCDSTVMSYFYQRGIASYNRGDYAAAIARYNDGLKRYPESPMLIMFRGNAHLARREFSEALRDYQFVVAHIDQTVDQMGANIRVPASGADERERLKANVLVTVLGSMADAQSRLGSMTDALATFDRAITVSEGTQPRLRITLHNSRGIMRMVMGDYDGAVRDFDEMINLDPSVSGAHTARALALFNSAVATPVSIRPDTSGAKPAGTMGSVILFPIARPEIRSREKANAAMKAAERAVETGPNADQALLVRGYLKWAIDGTTAGCVDLRRAAELGSKDAVEVMGVICR
jgi:tetratricopeptide (TPR) repeat protein